ncbi:hypothetical protein O1611_g7795 [Lasiodiplodia mahajangana]|uniref:Uncharacterized protein n=1 Tax=Lasiodiplodia mahajangana TaxID=1108764 RepID=A0ACC2JF48_9PEZI|nr:hypothetical protein O1611_g7795 [Lasiodiplodia mahajangana]
MPSTTQILGPGTMDADETENLMASIALYSSQQLQQPQQLQSHSLFNQHQHGQHRLPAAQQESTPPRQYTTVGSVYNPQSQPLQPPVRRGRTAKSFFPYKSESPAGPSQLQYTPLQQNSDRAVSPVRMDTNSLPETLNITQHHREVLQKFGLAVPDLPQPTIMSSRPRSPVSENISTRRYIGSRLASLADPIAEDNSTMFANTHTHSDDESDEADTKLISAMNFNTVTNLSSYPNAFQRAAQKLLASRRPHPSPAIGPHIPDSQSTRYYAEAELSVPRAEIPVYMPLHSKVPGAPAPLTAGPPGVRQHRPATFDQDILQRAREFDDENPMMNPYHARLPLNHHISGLSFEDESASPVPISWTVDDDIEDDNYTNDYVRIFDTLSTDEARSFYPNGLPLNFNPPTKPTCDDWEFERQKNVEDPSNWYSVQDAEFWAERSRHINNHFYSGVNKFNKTFNTVLSEHKHRSVAQVVGRPYKEQPSNQGKVINRELQVSDASLTPTSEQYEF